MEVKNIEAALAQAGEILEREPPFNQHEKDAYSRAARSAFEHIRKARSDGFSFVQICAALTKAGLLPREAHPHSFRQAFYRERRKQKRDDELKRIINGAETEKKAPALSAKTDTKKTDSAATDPNKATHLNGGEKTDLDKDREQLRRSLGNVVNTGLGTIIKHTDGSFDYD